MKVIGNNDNDYPERFDELSDKEQKLLIEWIDRNFSPIKSINAKHTSYALKELFEKSSDGFYICNGAFKGAMLKCGFRAGNKSDKNWHFNVLEKSIKRLYTSAN